MALPDWVGLAPALLLALTALAVFVIDSIEPHSENRTLLAGTTLLGTIAALVAAGTLLVTGIGTGSGLTLYDGQLVVDGMSLFFTIIFTSVAALVTLASYDYFVDRSDQAEYYILVLLATTGMTLLGSAGSLATVFVS